MFGNPSWFARRKYGGWGVMPRTWQGWAYVAVAALPFVVFQALPFWSPSVRTAVTVFWVGLVFFDVFDIMARMPRDERDRLHEALAERNALWAAVFVLAGGYVWRAAVAGPGAPLAVDPLVIAAVVAGLVAKAVSNVYLDRRD